MLPQPVNQKRIPPRKTNSAANNIQTAIIANGKLSAPAKTPTMKSMTITLVDHHTRGQE